MILYSTHQQEFRTIEAKTAREVIGMAENAAVSLIEKRGCIPFVEQRDKFLFDPPPTAHSYRIKMVIFRGKVIKSYLG